MSLFCDAGGYDTNGADWWWYQPADEAQPEMLLMRPESRRWRDGGAGRHAFA